jgi:integral membrane protein
VTETASTASAPTAPVEKVRGALLRYRVLAWITGIWLLLLVAELILAYGFDNKALDFVPIVHGWVYFVYLIMAVDLAIKVRWPAGKTIITAIAGTIPFLSFWFEHKRTQEVKAQFNL